MRMGTLKKNPEDKLKYYDESLRVNDTFMLAHWKKGVILCELKRDEEAIESFD
jgi:hypothetical protein